MNAYIIGGYRSAIGKAPRGAFRFTRPDDIAAAVIKKLLSDFPQIEKSRIDDVVVGNAFPAEFRAMMAASEAGDYNTARQKHYQLHRLIQLLFKEGNPGGIKATLKHLGICDGGVRLPLMPATSGLNEELLACLKANKLI